MSASGERNRPEHPGPSTARSSGELDEATDQGPAEVPTDARGAAPLLDEPALPRREAKKEDSRKVAPDPEIGAVVGEYVLLERLGKGGAGSVFRAERKRDGAVVALKVLSASRAKRARIVQRFFDEARTASLVQHRGLIRVMDFIEEEEPRRLAYAMEYLDGDTLRERLRKETALDLRDAIRIAAEVADALSALHDAGIIHRDLKPENIMILGGASSTGPRVKLLDFGVVKFLPVDRTSGHGPVTEEKAGTFVGTPRYMAPEQAAGGSIDARADLFALGVVLFEMITGACPHEGDSLRDVVLAKLKGAPRIKVNPGKEILPAELTDVVDACLQLKPALRPKSARDVLSALREAEVVLFAVGSIRTDASGAHFRVASLTDPGARPSGVPAAEGSGPKRLRPEEPKATERPAPVSRPREPAAALLPGAEPPAADTRGRMLRILILVMAILFFLLAAAIAFVKINREETVLVLPPDEHDVKKPAGAEGHPRTSSAAAGGARTASAAR